MNSLSNSVNKKEGSEAIKYCSQLKILAPMKKA